MDLTKHAAWIAVALLLSCVSGMALGVVGYLADIAWLLDIGEWLTVPLTVVLGGLVAVISGAALNLIVKPVSACDQRFVASAIERLQRLAALKRAPARVQHALRPLGGRRLPVLHLWRVLSTRRPSSTFAVHLARARARTSRATVLSVA